MPRVFIPAQWRNLAAGQDSFDLEGETVRQLVVALESRCPGISARICAGDRLAPGLAVSIDGVISNRGLRTPVAESQEVHFLPALVGG